jgi:hypothetical protein
VQHTDYTPADWVPKFADYLPLSFWTATAFSPTDVSAIKPWAKLLMMTEAGGVPRHRRTRDRPSGQHPEVKRSPPASPAGGLKPGSHIAAAASGAGDNGK